jgi:hypothetical protein
MNELLDVLVREGSSYRLCRNLSLELFVKTSKFAQYRLSNIVVEFAVWY